MNHLCTDQDCREEFKSAYENRYTWGSEFCGYKGTCILDNGSKIFRGTFDLGVDFKSNIFGIEEETINKAISYQLWEVAIHRVRRSFNDVHGQNNFVGGDVDDVGKKVLVTGKNKGDFYRIKNDVVTMVYRQIHGSYITIITESILNTEKGYLSKKYTSKYGDPTTSNQFQPKSHYLDTFVQLYLGGPWVLTERSIMTEMSKEKPETQLTYSFIDLHKLV